MIKYTITKTIQYPNGAIDRVENTYESDISNLQITNETEFSNEILMEKFAPEFEDKIENFADFDFVYNNDGQKVRAYWTPKKTPNIHMSAILDTFKFKQDS